MIDYGAIDAASPDKAALSSLSCRGAQRLEERSPRGKRSFVIGCSG